MGTVLQLQGDGSSKGLAGGRFFRWNGDGSEENGELQGDGSSGEMGTVPG
ncbi:MAG: hypothetical protein PHR92_00105 [Lachnospiraceae bacterium]|nr:hypothetical protein [Lachnospiraceae bacterium]